MSYFENKNINTHTLTVMNCVITINFSNCTYNHCLLVEDLQLVVENSFSIKHFRKETSFVS